MARQTLARVLRFAQVSASLIAWPRFVISNLFFRLPISVRQPSRPSVLLLAVRLTRLLLPEKRRKKRRKKR